MHHSRNRCALLARMASRGKDVEHVEIGKYEEWRLQAAKHSLGMASHRLLRAITCHSEPVDLYAPHRTRSLGPR